MASSVIEQVKLRAAETVQSFMIDMWLARQTPEKVMPILRKVVDGAKEEFADAVASGGGIYAVGYCFGGKYVLLLGSELPDGAVQPQKDVEQGMVKNEPLIKAGALAHGRNSTLGSKPFSSYYRHYDHATGSANPQITRVYGLRWYVSRKAL